MKSTFEPGAGVFEIILEKHEPILSSYNVRGACILRQVGDMYIVEKDYDDILPMEEVQEDR